jgi:DHA1 family inner membrane transport protein
MPLAPKIPASTSRLPLLALALASFGIGTTEFVIMGLLPDVAGDLGVTIPQAGLLVTGYALSVAFGLPFLPLQRQEWTGGRRCFC